MDTDIGGADDLPPQSADEVEGALPAGLHPIKRLEDFLKSHVGQTKALAGHVAAVAGKTSEAASAAARAAERADSLFGQFQTFARGVEARFQEVETKLAALAPPALGDDVEKGAKDLEAAVADAGAAVEAAKADPSYPPGEENRANS